MQMAVMHGRKRVSNYHVQVVEAVCLSDGTIESCQEILYTSKRTRLLVRLAIFQVHAHSAQLGAQ